MLWALWGSIISTVTDITDSWHWEERDGGWNRGGGDRARICANYHPLAVLHCFNHSNSVLTRQPLGDPGNLATLDINHKANTPMLNTDMTSCHPPQCVSFFFITLTDYHNNQGTHWIKEYVFSNPLFLPSSLFNFPFCGAASDLILSLFSFIPWVQWAEDGSFRKLHHWW